MVNLRVGPRGCDVAHTAMWLCQADARVSLCGKDVTWTRVIFNMYIGLPCIGRQSINSPPASYLIYPRYLLYFLQVGLKCFVFFDFKPRGISWSIGSLAR